MNDPYDIKNIANLHSQISEIDSVDHAISFGSTLQGCRALLAAIATRPGRFIALVPEAHEIRVAVAELSLGNISCIDHPSDLEPLLDKSVNGLFIQTPSDPPVWDVDIEAVVCQSRINGSFVLIDGSLTGPGHQGAFEAGADAVFYGDLNYITGHDQVAGSLLTTNSADLICEIGEIISTTDDISGLNPHAAWLVKAGLSTFDVRAARQERLAIELAEELRGIPQVSEVFHASFCPHSIKNHVKCGGGVIGVVFESNDCAKYVCDRIAESRVTTTLGPLAGASVNTALVRLGENSENLQRILRVTVGLVEVRGILEVMQEALKQY